MKCERERILPVLSHKVVPMLGLVAASATHLLLLPARPVACLLELLSYLFHCELAQDISSGLCIKRKTSRSC